jgi:hypothetical protein
MSWLLRGDEVLAAVEDRRPGWQASLQGAVILRYPAVVQTLTPSGARALDIASCAPAVLDEGRQAWRVRHITGLGRRRVLPSGLRAGGFVVAPAGTFDRWRLRVGDCLEVHGE